jgi:DNA-binding transcriptional LysR family regulator
MSFDQLHSFVTIAEEGALVRAARRLHVSQPPLTRKLRSLEDELGAALFERTARGVQLTPAGEALLPRARRVLQEVAEAKAAVGLVGGGLGGRRSGG